MCYGRLFSLNNKQLKRLDEVQLWVSKAETMIIEAEKLIEDGLQEMNKLCLGGCMSKNCLSSYKFGKKVTKLLEEISEHKSKGVFEKVAENQPAAPMEVRPTEQPIGLESTFDKVWSCIEQKDVGCIGLYGLGGVGKTTLLTQINNKFSATPIGFDTVIWVVVSKDHIVEKVQEKIGEKMGFSDAWKNKSADQKAVDIFSVLSNKKFVLLFDDLWERVDLEKVGIPRPSQANGSKLIFTTRSLEVCGEMEARNIIKVECLGPEEAWKLFEEKVGDETLNSLPIIRKLAEEVVSECGGLPLALITIGRAMAYKKTPQDWEYAIEKLKQPALPKMEKEVFPLLKFSYDTLSDTMRNCFLYCCLYMEDYNIPKKEIVENWFCEGLLNEFKTITKARKQGYSILNSLLSACLLESGYNEDFVKMHDVIRDMALWIACELEEEENSFFVKVGVQLIEAPNVEAWKRVKRMSLMRNEIGVLSGTPSCPNLQTLFINHNDLKMITDGFFHVMPHVRVLNLSRNGDLRKVPEGISELISLECLNLSFTSIEELPIKMMSLTKLKNLNLDRMYLLRRIPPNLISSFSMLEIFRMSQFGHELEFPEEDNVLKGGNECLIEELKRLQRLNVLSITVKNAFALERLLSFQRFQECTEELELLDYGESKQLKVLSLANLERLEKLNFQHCRRMEEINMEKIESMIFPINSTCFLTLSSVVIRPYNKLRDATWLILAPNLRYLEVGECDDMKEILSERKLGQVVDVVGIPCPNPFPKLQDLRLIGLSKLTSIYWATLPFPCLKSIMVRENCLQLKKLPFNCDSAKGNQLSIIGRRDWWENLKWEDDATRDAFLPFFKPLDI